MSTNAYEQNSRTILISLEESWLRPICCWRRSTELYAKHTNTWYCGQTVNWFVFNFWLLDLVMFPTESSLRLLCRVTASLFLIRFGTVYLRTHFQVRMPECLSINQSWFHATGIPDEPSERRCSLVVVRWNLTLGKNGIERSIPNRGNNQQERSVFRATH